MFSLSSPFLYSCPDYSSRYLDSMPRTSWEGSGGSEKQTVSFLGLCSLSLQVTEPLLGLLFLSVLLILHPYLQIHSPFFSSLICALGGCSLWIVSLIPLVFWLLLGFGQWEALTWDRGTHLSGYLFGHKSLLPHRPPWFGVWGSVKSHRVETKPWRCGVRGARRPEVVCPPGGMVDSELEIKFNYRELSNIFFPA